MQSFKLAENSLSFKLSDQSCSGGVCQPHKPLKARSDPTDRLDSFYDGLLKSTYVLCGGLIVYSLVMLNGLMATDQELRESNLLAKATVPLVSEYEEFWLNTVLSGEQAINPVKSVINWSEETLTDTFVFYDKALARVPEIVSTPPYARAKGLSP